ncbi:MAG: heme ABC transporter ATP-binding protein [Pseudomonadota bacterium]
MTIATHGVSLIAGAKTIIDDVSLSIRPGEVTALVGPNGAGKTTLLRMLSGDLRPTDGFVTMDGWPLHETSLADQARQRSVMTQHNSIAFEFTVSEVLSLGWEPFRAYAEFPTDRLVELTHDCDIAHLLGQTYNTLSGGERQRVQFARALLQLAGPINVQANRFLLLDEPTSSLDVAHELKLLQLVRQQAEAGVGVLIILHDLNLTARFCDRIVLLDNGRISAAGGPAECLTSEQLTALYHTAIHVEWHAGLERLVVHS